MTWLIDLIAGPILPYILAAGAALVSFMAYGSAKKKQGRTEVETDALRDSADRQEKGRDAVAEEQSETTGLSNSDIVERMRRRDH